MLWGAGAVRGQQLLNLTAQPGCSTEPPNLAPTCPQLFSLPLDAGRVSFCWCGRGAQLYAAADAGGISATGALELLWHTLKWAASDASPTAQLHALLALMHPPLKMRQRPVRRLVLSSIVHPTDFDGVAHHPAHRSLSPVHCFNCRI